MTEPGTAATYLVRPEGRVAYDVSGQGPLVVLVPGMGDLRGAYRFLAPQLREAGYRVACTELRGHGDSDATFSSYGDVETADDVVALIDDLGGPAVVIGNSMGAGSAVLVAADRPLLVRGLVLIGPFVRNPKPSAMKRALNEFHVGGIKTTIPLHLQIMDNEFFRSGEVDTGFVERVLLQK